MSPWSLDKSGSGFVFIEQWCTAYVSIWLRPSHCMFWLVTMTIGHVLSSLYHVWFLHVHMYIWKTKTQWERAHKYFKGLEKYLCLLSHCVFFFQMCPQKRQGWIWGQKFVNQALYLCENNEKEVFKTSPLHVYFSLMLWYRIKVFKNLRILVWGCTMCTFE